MGTLSVNEIQSVNHLLSHTQHAQLVIFRVLKSTSPARQQQKHVRQRNVFCYCDSHTILYWCHRADATEFIKFLTSYPERRVVKTP